jgi:hypothetical protein
MVAMLGSLTALRRLDLTGTGFANGGGHGKQQGRLRVDALLPALSGLTALCLGGLQLDQRACAGVDRLTSLRHLDLSGADFPASFVEGALGRLTRLTSLQLTWCSAGCLPLFGGLRRLELGVSEVGAVAHSAHGGEMRLERLACGNCQFDDVAAVALPLVLRWAGAGLRATAVMGEMPVRGSAEQPSAPLMSSDQSLFSSHPTPQGVSPSPRRP